ncbi:MAG: DinB family protein [Chloroflexi bacterium]|nr:DinB family protein [Chloroflexota bacterium]
MTKQIETESFKKELFDLLEETFERVQGIYLDRGTSFFETLDTISAEEASRPVSEKCASIATQVEHVRFYLEVLLKGSLQKQEIGKIDWEKSWQLKEVTADEWETLKKELKETHQHVLRAMKGLDIWEGEDDIGASLAILAHTAYHLGEIRQALCTIK